MFRFGEPLYLYLLILIPIIIGVYIFLRYQRRKRLSLFGNPETLKVLMPEVSTKRVNRKFILYILALACVILALARPQVGSKVREVKRQGVEIMLAVDVSNSMLTQDFEPSRLERTKYAISRLVEQLKEDRIGMIVFAGDAYVQLPITSDYAAARAFVNNLSTNMVSRQGTAIGAAINLAAKSFSSQSEGSRVIILISDGENHEDDPMAAAEAAAEMGIKIYTIGIGTPEGSPIAMGNGEFMKDESGEMVVTKLDEEILKKIALTTEGAYIKATNQSLGLTEIIEKVNQTQKKEFNAMIFDGFDEYYQYFLGLALIFMALDFMMLSRKNRILARFNIFSAKKQ